MDFEQISSGIGAIHGLTLGTVLENNNAEKKGTLKIRLGCEGATQNILEEVKLLSPYAGNQYGFFLLPEIGDQILVGFLDGSYDRPIALGSLYTLADQMLADGYHKSNAIKRFCTKGGTLVEFNDDPEGETILVKTKGKLALSMKEKDQRLTITSGQNTIQLDEKNGSVSIEAAKELGIKCGGASIKLTSGGELKLEGSTVAVKGSSVKVESSGALTAKGQKTELSGSLVEVKSSGIMTVKGSITKIN